MFLLQPPRGSFGTNRSRCHCPLLLSLGAGQLGPLRWFVSHLCLQRPVYCSGGGVEVFRLGLRWMSFHSGSRWMSFHPGSRWTFPTLIRGRLDSILMPSRGSSCQGPSLGRPLWVRSSAWLGHRSFGYWLPLEVRAGLEQAQLCHFPVIVASDPYPSCEPTEAL